ncbi:MAG: hypothetical protein ACYTBX_12545 [Planctomycetota bacterium]|jgi:hypothetical protein
MYASVIGGSILASGLFGWTPHLCAATAAPWYIGCESQRRCGVTRHAGSVPAYMLGDASRSSGGSNPISCRTAAATTFFPGTYRNAEIQKEAEPVSDRHRPRTNPQDCGVKTPSLCTSSVEQELINRKSRTRQPHLVDSAMKELTGVSRGCH